MSGGSGLPLFLLRLRVQGIFPEGAVFKLQRQGIFVYYLKKTEKNEIEFCIDRKNRKKTFTILNDSCYNIIRIENFGLAKVASFFRRRAGLVVGGALLFAVCLLSSVPVLKIEVEGSGAYYEKEVKAVLLENGVQLGRDFDPSLSPLLTARILSLKDVAFCSVKKRGNVLYVRVETGEGAPSSPSGTELLSPSDGSIYSLTVLKGEAQRASGEQVSAGEVLVRAKGGGLVMACVRLLCRYEKEWDADDEAGAYRCALSELGDQAEILRYEISKTAEGKYLVALEYLLTESVNMG